MSTFELSPVIDYSVESSVTISACDSTDLCTVLITKDPLPLLAEWPSFSFTPIGNRKSMTLPPICVSISPDSKRLVLGHADGTITFCDLKTKEFLMNIEISHDNPILKIKWVDDSILAVDMLNQVFKINILPKRKFSVEPELLFTCPEPILAITKIVQKVIYQNETTIHSLNLENNEISDIFSCPKNEAIHFTSSVDYFAVFHGCTLKLFSKDKLIEQCNLSSQIDHVFILTKNVIVAVLTNGTIELLIGLHSSPEICDSRPLKVAVLSSVLVFNSHDRLYLLSDMNLMSVSFIEWRDQLHRLASLHKWKKLFMLASGIYSGDNTKIFGVPIDVNERTQQVQRVMLDLFKEALIQDSRTESHITSILNAAYSMDLMEFITTTVPEILKDEILFSHCVMATHYIQPFLVILPPSVFVTYIRTHGSEKLLMKYRIPQPTAIQLIDAAIDLELHDFAIFLWTTSLNDFISPCIYLFQKKLFFTFGVSLFIDNIYKGVPDESKQIVLVWLLTCINDQFPRLLQLFDVNWEIASQFILSFDKLIPIELKDGTTLDHVSFFDSVLRTLCTTSLERSVGALDTLFSSVYQKGFVIPVSCLQHVLNWIFTSSSSTITRENLLLDLQKMYPFIVNIEDIFLNCEQAGFVGIVKETYMKQKKLSSLISTMIISPERRELVFGFIGECIGQYRDEIYKAITDNYEPLVILNPSLFIDIIGPNYPQFHKFIIDISGNPYPKYIYFKTLQNSAYADWMTPENDTELFALVCQFEPDLALPMLKSSHHLQLDEALPICLRYRVIDCCIHIETMLGQLEQAVKLVAGEIEQDLVEAIESNKQAHLSNIDLVAEEPLFKPAYDTLQMALDLISKIPEVGGTVEQMWRLLFSRFKLPLFLTRKIPHQETKRSYTLFFTYFVLMALSRISPEFVVDILRREFTEALEPIYFKQVFADIFKYMDYNQMVEGTVQQLLLDDCKYLQKKAHFVKTKGAMVIGTNCSSCQQIVDGSGGVGAQVFECGHIYHDNLACGGHRKCPRCNGQLPSKQEEPPQKNKRTSIIKQRLLARVEFGLKARYGKQATDSESGAGVFILPPLNYRYYNKVKPVVLQLPEEDPDNIVYSFLEL